MILFKNIYTDKLHDTALICIINTRRGKSVCLFPF